MGTIGVKAETIGANISMTEGESVSSRSTSNTLSAVSNSVGISSGHTQKIGVMVGFTYQSSRKDDDRPKQVGEEPDLQ